MKVLIVSFDKGLTEELRKALSDHEVYVAKNSEEAIKVIPASIEGVIYDAISGAISEEDINNLYTKKFSEARYIILYDELFPVDENNIIASKKLLMPRETPPQEIAKKLIEFPDAEVAVLDASDTEDVDSVVSKLDETLEEIEIEHTSLSTGQGEEIPELEEEIQQSPVEHLSVQEEETPATGELQSVQESTPVGEVKNKVLIVSFDTPLVDSIKDALEDEFEVEVVKNIKQAMEAGKDAKVVIFDAISGVIAERGLEEMSKNEVMASKHYVILVDDLFPINVDHINLKSKEVVPRDTSPVAIAEIVREEALKDQEPASQTQEVYEEEPTGTLEEPSQEITEQPIQEVSGPSVDLEEEQADMIGAEEEEEFLPALEALEKVMEGEEYKEEVKERESIQEDQHKVEDISIDQITSSIREEVKNVVSEAISEKVVREIITGVIENKVGDLKSIVEETIKEEVEKALKGLDIDSIIKQTTYKVLKERIEELIS